MLQREFGIADGTRWAKRRAQSVSLLQLARVAGDSHFRQIERGTSKPEDAADYAGGFIRGALDVLEPKGLATAV